MEYPKNAGSMIKKKYIKPITRKISSLTVLFTILFLAVGLVQAQIEWPKIVPSKDGTPIMKFTGLENQHLYSCMAGAAMPGTGVRSYHISLKNIAWS
jgi:hypothetical protein